MIRYAPIVLLACTFGATAQPVPDPAYGDGMVVQRDAPIVIEGRSPAGGTVQGVLGDDRASTKVDGSGRFRLEFAPRAETTTPLRLTLTDAGGSSAVEDILIGDVYLCSGQSNMELAVERALDTWNTLRTAGDAELRLLAIPKATAPLPQDRFDAPVEWVAADSDTVASFSAACYFMGRDLREARPDIPVGLIHASWGGSASSAWQTPEGIARLHGENVAAELALYARSPRLAAQAFAPRWFDWWRERDGGREPWRDPGSLDWRPVPAISFWNEWEGSGLDTDPAANVWLRQTLVLTAEQARAGGTLSIGAIDDLDMTFVNGAPVGYTFGWGTERHYEIPAEMLRAGENTILIAANNMWDTGGFYAGPDRLFFTPEGGAAVPLGAGWDYWVSPVEGTPPRAPWDANAGMGVMHNAMIAPLGPMRLAGVAWYQGEADIGQPGYDARLRELFAGWRRQFGEQARMLVVQLADYGERRSEPVASGWAELRQEQLDGVTADENAALVTAIDLGEPTDIHPANKNELGKRLAMAAKDEPMPMPASAVLSGDTVTVHFTGVAGDLRALGGHYPLGVELCGETQDSCRWALAVLERDRMLVRADGKPATRIRHGWADAPIINIYDARGLPLPGFELEIER